MFFFLPFLYFLIFFFKFFCFVIRLSSKSETPRLTIAVIEKKAIKIEVVMMMMRMMMIATMVV